MFLGRREVNLLGKCSRLAGECAWCPGVLCIVSKAGPVALILLPGSVALGQWRLILTRWEPKVLLLF